jgi:hypothetical protein
MLRIRLFDDAPEGEFAKYAFRRNGGTRTSRRPVRRMNVPIHPGDRDHLAAEASRAAIRILRRHPAAAIVHAIFQEVKSC